MKFIKWEQLKKDIYVYYKGPEDKCREYIAFSCLLCCVIVLRPQ